jgi:hypothetical protein
VTLVDGSLYKGDARTFLATRRRWLPRITVDVELESVCLYCSTVGLQYFGSWLIDDCPTYLLAHGAGQPATLDTPRSSHAIGYEQIFAMDPLRLRTAFFRELIVFDDFSPQASAVPPLGRTSVSHRGRPRLPGRFHPPRQPWCATHSRQ